MSDGQQFQRSSPAEVRNRLLKLRGAKDLMSLPRESRDAMRALLIELRRASAAEAQRMRQKHKAPMATYHKALSMCAGDMSRLLRDGKGTGASSDEAFEIADEAMRELVLSHCVGGAKDGRLGLCNESGTEVRTIGEAEHAIQSGFAWLQKRRLARLEDDEHGQVIVLVPTK